MKVKNIRIKEQKENSKNLKGRTVFPQSIVAGCSLSQINEIQMKFLVPPRKRNGVDPHFQFSVSVPYEHKLNCTNFTHTHIQITENTRSNEILLLKFATLHKSKNTSTVVHDNILAQIEKCSLLD